MTVKRFAGLVLAGLFMAVLSSSASAELSTLKGTLAVGGNEPLTTLIFTVDGGAHYQIRGPLTASLKAVGQGFVVEAVGRVGPKPKLFVAPFEVVQYRIVEVQTAQGRRKAFVGRIAVDGGDVNLVTDDLEIYLLQGSSIERLRQSAGARVCVAGESGSTGAEIKTLAVALFKFLPN